MIDTFLDLSIEQDITPNYHLTFMYAKLPTKDGLRMLCVDLFTRDRGMNSKVFFAEEERNSYPKEFLFNVQAGLGKSDSQKPDRGIND